MGCGATTAADAADGSAASPLVLWMGKTFVFVVTLTDKSTGRRVDLSLYQGRSQMRRSTADNGVPVATLTVTTLNAPRGIAEVRLGATASRTGAQPPIAPGRYVLDVEFERINDPDDVLFGGFFHVEVRGEVTQ